MNSLTRIVKSIAVVEERGDKAQAPVYAEPLRPSGVIKRRILEGGGAPTASQAIPTKDSYLDELNRLQVEIKQAKEELRSLGRQAEEARLEEARQEEIFDGSEIDASQAEEEAYTILKNAQIQAEQLLEEARQEGEALAEQAQNNGYLEGFEKGYQEAAQEFHSQYDPIMVQVADILDQLSEYQSQSLREQEHNLIELSITVARRILGQNLQADPGAVTQLFQELVEDNSREEYIKITLSPDLLPIQAKAGEKVRKLLTDLGANVTVAVDPELSQGGAVLETPKGVVDVSIETQLNNLKAAALDE